MLKTYLEQTQIQVFRSHKFHVLSISLLCLSRKAQRLDNIVLQIVGTEL